MSKCPLCKEEKHKTVYNYKFTMLQCQSCQLYFHEKYYTQEELKRFYADEYCYVKKALQDLKDTRKESFDKAQYEKYLAKSLRKHFVPVINKYLPFLDVLEIGADAGGASIYMREKGHIVDATEVCNEYASIMRTYNITVYQDFFENIDFGQKKYDVIVALEVLEHFSDPVYCVDKIYNLLKPKGSFIFETPIASNGLVNYASYGFQAAHRCIFNPNSLSLLLNRFKEIPEFAHGNGIYTVKK